MKQINLDISLLQPLVISQDAASAGAHHSLDYIPGSNLLGIAASRLYGELDSKNAFALFHSGRVRFGDGLPLSGHDVALPVPLSWHVFKGESPTTDPAANGSDKYFDSEKIFDASRAEAGNRQPEQLRSGYVDPDGRQIQPAMEQTLKTAIDAATGTAATSQLFGYEALSAGQHYHCILQADDEVDDALWQRLLDVLQGPARIGRSRSAQFGQVLISRADTAPVAFQFDPITADRQLTLWLTSDLLLLDQGQPCLTPRPQLLGLPADSKWLAERSFIRSRRYSSYNGYRRHYDPERQVICRGSILRYQLPASHDPALAEKLSRGLGRRQELGLGRLVVNPRLLAQAHPHFAERKHRSNKTDSTTHIPFPNTRLARLLKRRADEMKQSRNVTETSEYIYLNLCAEIGKARSYHGLLVGTPLPSVPQRSQWGRLRQLASDHRQRPQTLWKVLADDKNGVLRARSGWELRTGPGSDAMLGQWLQKALENYQQSNDLPDIVGQLANHGCSEHWTSCCLGHGREQNNEVSA